MRRIAEEDTKTWNIFHVTINGLDVIFQSPYKRLIVPVGLSKDSKVGDGFEKVWYEIVDSETKEVKREKFIVTQDDVDFYKATI